MPSLPPFSPSLTASSFERSSRDTPSSSSSGSPPSTRFSPTSFRASSLIKPSSRATLQTSPASPQHLTLRRTSHERRGLTSSLSERSSPCFAGTLSVRWRLPAAGPRSSRASAASAARADLAFSSLSLKLSFSSFASGGRTSSMRRMVSTASWMGISKEPLVAVDGFLDLMSSSRSSHHPSTL